ncbi:MAG: Gfo/Idh/MocA family protein, partial [Tepidisphaeraceae bacterium]
MNVGIIGFGRIGAEHAQWLSSATGIRAIAALDVTQARRDLASAQGLRAFDSVDAFLACADIDAVLVATPNSFHFDHARRALLSGKHVMVEKPMTLNLSDASRLASEAVKLRKTLSVFHNRRW